MFRKMLILLFAACCATISMAEIQPVTQPVMGGHNSMDLTNAESRKRAEDLTDFAVQKINAKSNDLFHHARVKVLEAKSQVVAGAKYTISFYMGQTTCAKNQVQHDQVTAQRCPISNEPTAKFNKCTVTIWEKAWENFKEMLSDNCQAVQRSEAMRS